MALRTALPEEHLYRMIEQTLVPPTTVVELDTDPILASTARLGDVMGSVSERYHLDSMLTPAERRRMPTAAESSTIREYFLTTTAEGYERMLSRGGRWARRHPDGPLRDVLQVAWTDPVAASAMFGVDLLASDDGAVWRQVPGRDGGLREQSLSGDDHARLAAALGAPDGDPGHLIVVVGAFARAAFLYGKRTSRNVSMNAGVVLGALVRSCALQGLPATVVTQFVDRDVNDLLGNDGVDRGVLAALLVPAHTSPEGERA